MIPFVDLKLQFNLHKEEFMQAIENVCANTAFILGKEVSEFEKHFAEFIGTRYAVGVATGTDALHLALRTLGIGPGDEVITAANTFYATTSAIELAGARPVLVDCDPDTYLMDIDAVEKVITPKTKGIIPVHLYGQVVAMDALAAIAERNNLFVLEDACQAHGACYKDKGAGSFGNAAAFSFYPGKNLGAFGDGGAVTTDDAAIYEKLLAVRNYGSTRKYHHPTFGTNSRLDGVQAAVLNIKLRHLTEWNSSRQRAAERYKKNLASNAAIKLPVSAENSTHVYHLFVVQVESDRDGIIDALAQKGVQSGIHYPVPIHLHGAYSYLGYKKGDFPCSEAAAGKILSLPMFPEITDAQVDEVCEKLLELL